MPNFDIKTTFNSKTKKNIKEVTVLEKNVRAAIYVDLHNRYYVKLITNGEKLDIYHKSYNCKDKENIYLRVTPDIHRVCIMRRKENRSEVNNLFYLPFAVGHLAVGDVIIDNITNRKLFHIKKSTSDKYNAYCYEAFQYYKANKDIIDKAILKKREEYGISAY